MILSFLSKSDLLLLDQLNKKDFSDGWKLNQLECAFESGRFFAIGAFDGKKLIGAITVSRSFDDADIEGVVTDSEFRKHGVASELIDRAQVELEKLGVKRALLEVRENNIVARSLYKKKGFTELSVRKKYYSDGENAVVMVKEF